MESLTKEYFIEKINNSDAWLVRSILAIYSNQTKDEQFSEQTSYQNGIGFTGVDAKILSSFAKQIQERIELFNTGKVEYTKFNPVLRVSNLLSVKQKAIAVKKMPKYFKQLSKIVK